jgi:2-haloacid dehalogenase
VTTVPVVLDPADRPAGHRAVPLLTEPALGHYAEFRAFLLDALGLGADRVGPSGLLRVDGRHYEVVLLGRSGQPYPSGVEIQALVPGLEPLDEEAADADVWAILQWLVDGVGGEWSAEALTTTGRIYRIPAVSPPVRSEPGERRPVVAFDLYGTLVDPLALATDLARHLPSEDARRVATTWRRTQLEYAFRLTAMQRYADFAALTARALDFALLEAGRSLDPADRTAVLARYDALEPYPDVLPALRELRAAGVETLVLSNGSTAMLEACLDNAGVRPHLDHVLSVDRVRAFKPDPAVYRLAARVTGRPLADLHLVSCNPFDIVGAAAAGMRTVWVNRAAGPFDTLGAQPEHTVATLAELPALLATGAGR